MLELNFHRPHGIHYFEKPRVSIMTGMVSRFIVYDSSMKCLRAEGEIAQMIKVFRSIIRIMYRVWY